MSKATATFNQARSGRSLSPAIGKQSARPTADAPTAATRQQPPSAVTEEEIRLRAYLKWEAEGRPEGHDLFFWCEAERELLQGD
jgi:hypothetical protein